MFIIQLWAFPLCQGGNKTTLCPFQSPQLPLHHGNAEVCELTRFIGVWFSNLALYLKSGICDTFLLIVTFLSDDEGVYILSSNTTENKNLYNINFLMELSVNCGGH